MPSSQDQARQQLRRIFASQGEDAEKLRARLRPDLETPPKRPVPGASLVGERAVRKRWGVITPTDQVPDPDPRLYDREAAAQAEAFENNIENYIGTLKLPVGVAGPLRVNGVWAKGDFYVPLATTEAALVASYHRGALALSEAGGCTAILLMEGVSRAPGFIFNSIVEAGEFLAWVVPRQEELAAVAAGTSRFGRLIEMRAMVEGNHIYLPLTYHTGQAAGQNMVTVATQAVCEYILANCPVKPRQYFVEANFSGDKKASALSFQGVRGKKVSAEVRLPAELLEKRLHTSAAGMEEYWRMSALGGVLSGTIGVQGHYANGLAALFLATGQDVACVSEAAVGVTRFEAQPDGSLYASVMLPNLIVGSVGGGTGLPSQRACTEILRLPEENASHALAEIAAGLALAGELSIIAALASQEFTRAHKKRARGRDEVKASG
jgi:hydroxymethylglutaryl-CoA reductase (NADPH)